MILQILGDAGLQCLGVDLFVPSQRQSRQILRYHPLRHCRPVVIASWAPWAQYNLEIAIDTAL